MKVISLVENTTIDKKYKNKHGLSLYIEHEDYKILFDLGPDKTFFDNAKKLGVDISDIDIVIISHGHSDHGGGLKTFLKENSKAKIYINEKGFGQYYTKVLKFAKVYVGLDKSLEGNNRIIKVSGNYNIDEKLFIFNNTHSEYLEPTTNEALLSKKDGSFVKDDFSHEQSLLLKSDDRNILFSGCSHKGIVNIIKSANDILNGELDIVFAGFHLYNPVSKKSESSSFIDTVGSGLEKMGHKYYTFHCTGEKAFNILEEKLGERITYLRTGGKVEI